MTVQSPVTIHSSHQQQWQTEVTRWHNDVSSWRHECRKALRDLRRLEGALQEHDKVLQDYVEGLASYEERLASQEWAHEAVPPAGAEDVVVQPPVSSEQAAKHCRQQDAHERCRRRHYTLMAHWSLLCETLTGVQP